MWLRGEGDCAAPGGYAPDLVCALHRGLPVQPRRAADSRGTVSRSASPGPHLGSAPRRKDCGDLRPTGADAPARRAIGGARRRRGRPGATTRPRSQPMECNRDCGGPTVAAAFGPGGHLLPFSCRGGHRGGALPCADVRRYLLGARGGLLCPIGAQHAVCVAHPQSGRGRRAVGARRPASES